MHSIWSALFYIRAVRIMSSKKWYFSDSILGAVMLTFFVLVAGSFFQLPFIYLSQKIMSSNPALGTILNYSSFIGIWAAVCIFMLLIKRDRYLFSYIIPNKTGNSWKNALTGLLIGFAMNAICIAFASVKGDIHLHFSGTSIFILLIAFFAVFIQSSAEELIVRVFLYQHLFRSHKSSLIPIVITSVFFAAMHMFNNGIGIVPIIDITVSGFLFALMIFYFNSFAMAAMCHTGWNFTQAILFGLPNSGNVTPFSLFKLDAVIGNSAFFYDPVFGIEGSWMAIIVQVLAIIFIILKGENHNKEHVI